MADPVYIRMALDAIGAVLEARTPALLAGMGRAPFTGIKRAFSGQMLNPPMVWIEPRKTAIDDTGNPPQQHASVTVVVGVMAGDPEALLDAALDYVRAVTLAIEQAGGAEWGDNITHVHPSEMDYGPLFTGDKGGFAKFPMVHVEVEMTEVYE